MNSNYLDTDFEKKPSLYKEYGGFFERFGAALIDSTLMSIVSILVFGAFGITLDDVMLSGGENEQIAAAFGAKYYIASLVNIAINWYYYAQQESSEYQATLGKRALGLVVTDIKGQRIPFSQASVRFLVKEALSFLLLLASYTGTHSAIIPLSLFAFAGYVIQPFTEHRQAFHDIVAKTLVYKKKIQK